MTQPVNYVLEQLGGTAILTGADPCNLGSQVRTIDASAGVVGFYQPSFAAKGAIILDFEVVGQAANGDTATFRSVVSAQQTSPGIFTILAVTPIISQTAGVLGGATFMAVTGSGFIAFVVSSGAVLVANWKGVGSAMSVP